MGIVTVTKACQLVLKLTSCIVILAFYALGIYVQWRATVFGHPLKSHNFFKINLDVFSFFEQLEALVC